MTHPHLQVGLHAAVIAVDDEVPLYLTVAGKNARGETLDGLPFGPYKPGLHRTLDTGLRSWVEDQTRLRLGYVEQLYTFGDIGRMHGADDGSENFVSVGYLALVRKPDRAEVDVEVDYLGFDIPDVWVVGYGLDLADRHRTLPYIGQVDAG